MAIYIAFLRGINVGGKNIIKMADLKQAFATIGLSRVQTYIQSGNALFESSDAEQPLSRKIGQHLEKTFGLPVAVILRTAAELEQIVLSCPFTSEQISQAEAASQVESLYVALLEQAPVPEASQRIEAYRNETDEYRIINRECYLLFHHSIRDSKLANNLHKLNVPLTVRNWKTVSKLAELAREMKV